MGLPGTVLGDTLLQVLAGSPRQYLFKLSFEPVILIVRANCSFEKEFDGVQDVFELQVRLFSEPPKPRR